MAAEGTAAQCDRRLVIYGGPGKTGSSSIQDFYSLRACSDRPDHKLPVFANWTMPKHYYAHFCMHMQMPDKADVKQHALSEGAQLREKQAALPNRQNVFLACEYTASIFQEEEYSSSFRMRGQESADSIFNVMDYIGYGCPEFVFHYRAPRAAHWISAWKQATRKLSTFAVSGYSIKNYVCAKEASFAFRFFTLGFMDPLRAVSDFRKPRFHPNDEAREHPTDWPVTLVDMSGVAKARRDVVHVMACDIMGVPCTEDWLINGTNPETVHRLNQRERTDVDITDEQRAAIETIFRRRDCLYRDQLESDDKVSILYKDTLWEGCPEIIPDSYRALLDGDYVLANIRAIIGCTGSLPFNFTTMEVGEGVDKSGTPMNVSVNIALIRSSKALAKRRQERQQYQQPSSAKQKFTHTSNEKSNVTKTNGLTRYNRTAKARVINLASGPMPIPFKQSCGTNSAFDYSVFSFPLVETNHADTFDLVCRSMMGDFERRLQMAVLGLFLVFLAMFHRRSRRRARRQQNKV